MDTIFEMHGNGGKKKEKDSTAVRRYKYDEKKPDQVFRLALLGATDKEIAEVFGVSISELDRWKKVKEGFYEAMIRGKVEADSKVAEALFKRATGFTYEADHYSVIDGKPVITKVKKYVLPDSWAAMKWLAIRQRREWSEVQRSEILQTNVNINKFDFTGISTEELRMLKQIGLKQIAENARDN